MATPQPLRGIRILDLSRILAGPSCTQLLGDLGADVLKIERPIKGDDTRHWGPPYVADDPQQTSEHSAYFICTNRNKRGLTIDITKPEGVKLIKEMLAKCDVLVENYKLNGLTKYGLDYASLKTEFPNLVYCSITGFGQTGPYAQRPGYDYIIQGMGGIMSITGESTGQPQKVGVAIADIMTGMYASVAIQAAIRHVEQGKIDDPEGAYGQHIDMSLLDCQAAWLMNVASNYLTSGVVPSRLGNAHPNIVPYQVFATSDGHIILAVGNDEQFQRFCALCDQASLAEDPRFASNAARVENRQTLTAILTPILQSNSSGHWLSILEQHQVPAGPINTIDQVFDDPQIIARNMLTELDNPCVSSGKTTVVSNPIRFSATPVQYHQGPPTLGQHNDEVLRELLDMSDEAIADLRAENII